MSVVMRKGRKRSVKEVPPFKGARVSPIPVWAGRNSISCVMDSSSVDVDVAAKRLRIQNEAGKKAWKRLDHAGNGRFQARCYVKTWMG